MTETSTSGTGRDIAERGTGQLFQNHPIELNKRDGKRYQNRLAQRTYSAKLPLSSNANGLQCKLIITL